MSDIIASDPPVVVIAVSSMVVYIGSLVTSEMRRASSRSRAVVHCPSSVSIASVDDSIRGCVTTSEDALVVPV